MNIHLVTYADENMTVSQKLCGYSAKETSSIRSHFQFGPEHFDSVFKKFNASILSQTQRGGGKGFWLFKPYFLHHVLMNVPSGDYVVYADSGVMFIDSIQPIIEYMAANNEPIFLFGNEHRHIDWCKREVAQSILQCNKEELVSRYSFNRQAQASVIIMKANIFSRDFCKRWLVWCQIPGFIEDKSAYEQLPEFADHRNDQSILTCLAIQDNIKLHWWPAQYGFSIRHAYKDTYGQLFFHHRYRNYEWENITTTPQQFFNHYKK